MYGRTRTQWPQDATISGQTRRRPSDGVWENPWRKTGGPLRWPAETQTRELSLCRPPGEKVVDVEPSHHARHYEASPLGCIGIGRPGQVHGVDAGRPAPSGRLSRTADRQTGKGRGPRIEIPR